MIPTAIPFTIFFPTSSRIITDGECIPNTLFILSITAAPKFLIILKIQSLALSIPLPIPFIRFKPISGILPEPNILFTASITPLAIPFMVLNIASLKAKKPFFIRFKKLDPMLLIPSPLNIYLIPATMLLPMPLIASTILFFKAIAPFLIPLIIFEPSFAQLNKVNTLTMARIICGIFLISVGIASIRPLPSIIIISRAAFNIFGP